MNNIPSVKIAMFGSRSTGKTNFLASFIGVDSTQGCSIDFNDSETRKQLHKNWKCLLQGDLPKATAMTDEKPLIFKLRRKVKEQARDEWVWNVTMKDYPGKLMEDDEDSDEISAAIKLKLDAHIQEADAILFLAPVEIREWEPAQQQLYVAYIKNCVSIAKEYREKHGRSIPFCLALMKWDQTGITSDPSSIDERGVHLTAPEVEQFLRENDIFNRIYTVIQDLSNQEVAVFATSSYGSHTPEDKGRPDPNNLRPFNIIPILHWLCTSVENVRLDTLRRDVNALTAEVETEETLSQIEDLYAKYLESGVNDSIIEKEIQQRARDVHDQHIQVFEKKFQEQMEIIDGDSKSSNPWAEKVHWYQDKLNRQLFHEDDERELRYELEDLQIKAQKRAKNIFLTRVGIVAGTTLLVILGVIAGTLASWVSTNAASYAQGDALIAKDDKNLTYEDFRKAEKFFSIPQCPLENRWWLKGRREKFYERKNTFIEATCSELDKKLATITIEGTNQEKVSALNQKIRLIQGFEKNEKMFPEVFQRQYAPMIAELEAEQTYCAKAQKLEALVSAIQGADVTKRLTEIANLEKEFVRTDFHSVELDLFARVDEIRKSTIDELALKIQDELALVSDESVEEDNFIELKKRAGERADIYNKYCEYYPEGDTATALKQKADEAAKRVEELAKYTTLQEEYKQISTSPFSEKKAKAEKFLSDYKVEEYPKAGNIFAGIEGIIQEVIAQTLNAMKDEMEPIEDNPTDSLDVRYSNAQKRIEICKKYQSDFESGSERTRIDNLITAAENLCNDLDNWKKFEQAFSELKTELASSDAGTNSKISKCAEFLSSYTKSEYHGYSKYQVAVDEITQKKLYLENAEKIEGVCHQFEEFEKEFERNSEEYASNAAKITSLQSQLAPYRADATVTACLGKLEQMKSKNEEKWEDYEYEKVCSQISSLKSFPSENGVENALSAINSYLFASGTPKKHADVVNKKKDFLERIQGSCNITVTLKMYKVKGTKFDGWGKQETVFKFGSSSGTITNYAGEDEVRPNKPSASFDDKCSSSWSVEAVYPRKSAHGSTTVDVLSRVIKGDSLSFSVTIDGMPVEFSISGFPSVPYDF